MVAGEQLAEELSVARQSLYEVADQRDKAMRIVDAVRLALGDCYGNEVGQKYGQIIHSIRAIVGEKRKP